MVYSLSLTVGHSLLPLALHKPVLDKHDGDLHFVVLQVHVLTRPDLRNQATILFRTANPDLHEFTCLAYSAASSIPDESKRQQRIAKSLHKC